MIPLQELTTPALAYLGDCVLELMVRERLVCAGLSKSGSLHGGALQYVRASAQAAAMERILPCLTEEEAQIFRRGRNMGHLNVPKNASIGEYRMATGMEVLFGYLHLAGKTERLHELFCQGYENKEEITENRKEEN